MGEPSFNLGFGGSRETPQSFFGLSPIEELNADLFSTEPSILTLPDFIHRPPPHPASSIGQLTTDFTATQIPSVTPVSTTVSLGQGLHDIVHTVEDPANSESQLEAGICRTAKVVAETAFNVVGTGVIVGGTGLLLTESVAYPPLAAAIPVVGELLPQAYANMTEFSKFAGDKAEQDCHTLFREF